MVRIDLEKSLFLRSERPLGVLGVQTELDWRGLFLVGKPMSSGNAGRGDFSSHSYLGRIYLVLIF